VRLYPRIGGQKSAWAKVPVNRNFRISKFKPECLTYIKMAAAPQRLHFNLSNDVFCKTCLGIPCDVTELVMVVAIQAISGKEVANDVKLQNISNCRVRKTT
jgi:hypothetical protein